MKRNVIDRTRYIERDTMYSMILHNSKHMTLQQINQILDAQTNWSDITFTFYDDGKCSILDNDNDTVLSPGHLTGECLNFYVNKRLEIIKNKIKQSVYNKRAVV